MPSPRVRISPEDKAIAQYLKAKQALVKKQGVTGEGQLRSAFADLLKDVAVKRNWMLVEELSERVKGRTIRPDGTLRDEWRLPHGYWEAKDSADDLQSEVRKKRERGYPFSNIIFEDTQQAILYQDEQPVLKADLADPADIARLLTEFLSYDVPPFAEFEEAVEAFKEQVPRIAQALLARIQAAHRDNKKFQAAFDSFRELCQNSLNPNISNAAIDEMLIQHLLTERLIRRIFKVEEFTRRNVIARKVEEVITALTSEHFNRTEFLGSLDRFYTAIERAADRLADIHEKQHFLNTVYERFFQGYSVQVADTHGIVYTPQPIVDFMCAAVEEALREEFNTALGDDNVYVLDPCTGTGSFIVNLLHRVNVRNRPDFYKKRLFANEVMLMPYYIASLNIEHEYNQLEGRYEPFEGICFVDTLDIAKQAQMKMFTEENAERVQRQLEAPITVIIGNPPYNVGQVNENDNNKNRQYPVVDARVRETYAAASAATNKNALYDAYVKFFRWATDRLEGRDGIVCFVSNNSFIDSLAFDGMRKHLLQDFHRVYVLDLHGNVRQNPKLSGTTHNVFGIQVGVAITIAVRSKSYSDHRLYYHRVPELWRKEEKYAFLEAHTGEDDQRQAVAIRNIQWRRLIPDARHNWLISEHAAEFAAGIPMGSKAAKKKQAGAEKTLFSTYSGGVKTNRDTHVYDFDRAALISRVRQFIEDYNREVDRYKRALVQEDNVNIDDFVDTERIKWDGTLKGHLKHKRYIPPFAESRLRRSLYRPFTTKWLYFEPRLINSIYLQPYFFPTPASEAENRAICVTDKGSEKRFMVMVTTGLVDLHLVGAGSSAQTFPFYVYDAEGNNRRENITDWALHQFRQHYGDETITKWDIFYYIYGLLHHPAYRRRYADDLKKALPRIPFAPDFRAFSQAGQRLADIHLGYETCERYHLDWQTGAGAPDFRVKKMQPIKKRKVQGEDGQYTVFNSLRYNDYLTLDGIPDEAFRYRLGNRSALEWLIEQYRIKEDKRSGITHDPNRYSTEPRYIVHLIERVVQVSLDTVAIIDALAAQPFREGETIALSEE